MRCSGLTRILLLCCAVLRCAVSSRAVAALPQGVCVANNQRCVIKILKPVKKKKIRREIKILQVRMVWDFQAWVLRYQQPGFAALCRSPVAGRQDLESFLVAAVLVAAASVLGSGGGGGRALL